MKDLVDRVVLNDENEHLLKRKDLPSTIVKLCLPSSNLFYRKIKRRKTSIAIQTSSNEQQQRNAKIQTNMMILYPFIRENRLISKIE